MLARSNITEVSRGDFNRLYPPLGAKGGHSNRADEQVLLHDHAPYTWRYVHHKHS